MAPWLFKIVTPGLRFKVECRDEWMEITPSGLQKVDLFVMSAVAGLELLC